VNDLLNFILAGKIFAGFPFALKKVASNSIDAAHRISRNIAEGYCRRSLKEYLNHLNISLGSCGEFHCCYESFKQAHEISDDEYEQMDQLHYKLEMEKTVLKSCPLRFQSAGAR